MTIDQKTTLRVWAGQLPNQLTLARIAVIPVILVIYPLDFKFLRILCAFLFLAAAITDILDGYFARRDGTVSKLGALMDPIADKVLATAALFVLVSAGNIPTWMAGALVCRDIAVSGLRLAALEQGIEISVSFWGKLKTILQDTCIFCLMVNEPLFDLPFRAIGMISLWIALLVSIWSGYLYFIAFFEKSESRSAPV